MNRTAIIAPLSARGGLGDADANVAFALAAAELVRAAGEIPMDFAWIATDSGWLDDDAGEERRLGIEIGHRLMAQCCRARVFLPPGCAMTPGMVEDVRYIRANGYRGARVPIYIGLSEIEVASEEGRRATAGLSRRSDSRPRDNGGYPLLADLDTE